MKSAGKKAIWLVWLLVTASIAGYYGYKIFYAEDKRELLIGEASHGHFQIELACSACHTDPFGGQEILQNACLNCHEQELESAHDSHPKKKFNDPRNADRLAVIDARYCVSCHTEHQKSQTHPMGVTVPDDYCFHCHQDVGDNRPSHKDLPFESCASAGCHNYHDNRALYENFLVANADQPWISAIAEIAQPSRAKQMDLSKALERLPQSQYQFESKIEQNPDIHHQWLMSGHGEAGVGCASCHATQQGDWIEKPGVEACSSCHVAEVNGFKAGKHGMRLAQGMSSVSPEDSQLPFHDSAKNVQHGCTSCHGSHSFDTKIAAQQACVACHSDQHSQSFLSSPHGKLMKDAFSGHISWDKAVTCATCHMPRMQMDNTGTPIDSKQSEVKTDDQGNRSAEKSRHHLGVLHNQNAVLRPNEKMIRPVCMQCHSLEFSIDALADPTLIENNFNGQPKEHVPSIDWALERSKK